MHRHRSRQQARLNVLAGAKRDIGSAPPTLQLGALERFQRALQLPLSVALRLDLFDSLRKGRRTEGLALLRIYSASCHPLRFGNLTHRTNPNLQSGTERACLSTIRADARVHPAVTGQ